jgi:hypothetical protein
MTELLKTPYPPALHARRLKVTMVLDASELLSIRVLDDKPRVTLRIGLPDRIVTVDLAAKSVRKAQTAIRESGASNIELVLQGHLIGGDVIAEAGLAAQAKAPKTTQAPAPK